MAIRMDKPWLDLDAPAVQGLSGQLGIYEIADGGGNVVYIGVVGGRSQYGLRGELQGELDRRGAGFRFRYEVNMQYSTRHRELLMVYAADHGALPPENAKSPPLGLGRMSPA
jgi:hypothetical protein